MQAIRRILAEHPMELIWPLAIFVGTFLLGLLIRRLVLRALHAWTARTGSRPGLILTEALRGPILIWCLILALHLAIQISDLPAKLTGWSSTALLILQVRLGDYIKLNASGEEGYVTDIGWRSTTIRTLDNSMIIVPNAKLAQAIVTNYHLPEKQMASKVQVGVSYGSDPEQIERVLLDIGRQGAQEIPGMVAEPGPSVMFDPGFGESALGFTLNYHIAEFANQFSVRHELRKRIFHRFRKEGIEIPFPTRTVQLVGPYQPKV